MGLALRYLGACAALGVAAASLASVLPGCGDQACIRWAADRGECPSEDDAMALMDLACKHVDTVDQPGTRDEADLCCYDVTYKDYDLCDNPSPEARPSPAGPGGTAGSTGAQCDGSETSFCSTCIACAEIGACAEAKLTCDSNPSCQPLRRCVESCPDGDNTCVDGCTTGHEQGVDNLTTLYECLLCGSCMTACESGGACADPGG